MLNVSCIIKHQAGKLYLITYCGRFNFCHDTKIWFEKHIIQYVMVFYCTTMFVLWPLSGTFPTSSSYTTPNVNISVFLGPALLFRGPALTALCLTFAFFLPCCFCNMSADWRVFWRNSEFIFAFRSESWRVLISRKKFVYTTVFFVLLR